MTWLSAIIMGLVQGIAEFLPISSSGHLAIAEHLLNMQGASEIPQFYDVLLHLGTLFAVFAAYWDDIRDMVVEFFTGIGDLAHHRTPNPVPPARRLILLIIVGTLPLFVMVPFRHFFSSLGDNMYFIGGALMGSLITTIDPKMFNFQLTFNILMFVVVGGLGSITGSLIGTVVITVLLEWLRVVEEPLDLGFVEIPGIPGMRMVVFSVCLLLIILYRREGIMGMREITWDSLAAFLSRLGRKKERKA